MSGPMPNPAKPHSRYRDRNRSGFGLVVLPHTCDLPVPSLPGGREWTEQERQTWEDLWTGPQASQWDDSFIPAVAMFVVNCSNILAGQSSAWMAQEARHLSDRLGLTPQGMRALGWVFAQQGGAGAQVKPLKGA